jgi:hypothetical protein
VQGSNVNFETSRVGDRLFASVDFELRDQSAEFVFTYDEGTDVYLVPDIPAPGSGSKGLRILRSIADGRGLRLILEGQGGHSYSLFVRSPHQLEETMGVGLSSTKGNDQQLNVKFEGSPDVYVRREFTIPFDKKAK